MSTLDHRDLFMELVDLSTEVINDIRQELRYYRASVYKNESADRINAKVEEVRFLCQVFSDDGLTEVLNDYDAERRSVSFNSMPSECPFFARVSRLLSVLSLQLAQFEKKIVQSECRTVLMEKMADSLKVHRQQVMQLSRTGSRKWSSFQTL